MTVRQYYLNLYRINTQEIPNLPPFGTRQSFCEDEFIDIIIYGTPGSWAREMDRQGFDPMDHTAEEVVAFMEQLESAEAHDKTSTKVEAKKTDKSSPSNKKKSSKEGSPKKETKYCEIHGWCSHTSEECRSSKNKRYKEDKSDSKKPHSSKGNKSWKKSSEEETMVTKKDLALLVKKAVKKEIATTKDKKRKASDDEDGFLVECLTKDINGFNYKEMEDLRIDSQDEDTESEDEVSC